MQAERAILETDEDGRVSELPPLPPCSTVEAIFEVLDAAKPGQQPAPTESVSRAQPGRSLVEMIQRWNALCNLPADDHFSGEDHDEVLSSC